MLPRVALRGRSSVIYSHRDGFLPPQTNITAASSRSLHIWGNYHRKGGVLGTGPCFVASVNGAVKCKEAPPRPIEPTEGGGYQKQTGDSCDVKCCGVTRPSLLAAAAPRRNTACAVPVKLHECLKHVKATESVMRRYGIRSGRFTACYKKVFFTGSRCLLHHFFPMSSTNMDWIPVA